jgi:periplasmic copper chaperone A
VKIPSQAWAAALAFAACTALAQNFSAGAIRIEHPFARATVGGQPTGGAFMTFVNEGETDRLLSASAPIAKSVELHEMRLEGDVMKMRQVDGIDLGGGKTVELKPGGYHIMFVGLNAPLVAGTSFPLLLHFQKAGAVAISVKVEAPGDTMRPRADVSRFSAPAPAAPT